jgi:hypothetical protein
MAAVHQRVFQRLSLDSFEILFYEFQRTSSMASTAVWPQLYPKLA